jgi:prolyl oligopeptidase
MTKQILGMLFFFGPLFSKGASMTDPYLWLEDRNGSQAVEWVRGENKITRDTLEAHPQFAPSFQRLHEILTAKDKLPSVREMLDGFVYDLWQDEEHPRGLFRRTSLADFKKTTPAWTVLLDIDSLAQTEKTPWVFKGIVTRPGSDRCLVGLSRNGQDATEYREYSLKEKTFVPGGFFFPESKSHFAWQDENHLLVNSSLAPEDRTESGYGRSVDLWTRGDEFSKAKRIYTVGKENVFAMAFVFHDQEKSYSMVGRLLADESAETFLLGPQQQLLKLPISMDMEPLLVFDGKLLFELKKSWRGFSAGSVLAVSMSAAGQERVSPEDLSAVYTPTPHSAFSSLGRTKNKLYLLAHENVKTKPYEVHHEGNSTWILSPVFSPGDTSFSLGALDATADAAFFMEEGYLQPRQMLVQEGVASTKVKSAKSWFEEAHFVTEQFWVQSKDGVEIPYTVVRAKDLPLKGANPTLLYGYGGFQISLTPTYSPTVGSQWLAKGGVYVVANIRGGGEFGPAWHNAAILENKQKSYDDFIAVAEDLIARKITSPRHLGIQGGSNGGLLVGAVTMQRPELFNAVLCQIPLLDMIRYTELPPGASWASEYGDPKDAKMREVILKYSPYQNISATKKYPKMFFQTTQADDRVHPGHARKMVARMKELGHKVYLFEATDGGHGGGGVKPEDQARTLAYLYTFLYSQLVE